MVDTGELENYLNEKSAKEGDVCEILSEGVFEEKESQNNDTKYKVLNLPVKLNGSRELTYTPNKDAVTEFQKAFGMDSKDWVGRKFQVKFYPKTAYGVTKTAILPMPIKEQKA